MNRNLNSGAETSAAFVAASGIVGVGIDLVENARLAGSISKFGDRFLRRVFCGGEIDYCQRMRNPVPHYAARFAAKEATAKAFGCGIGEHLSFLDMEVTRSESGAPALLLHGAGRDLAARRGVTHILISLSHTEHYATASIVLTGAAL